ncbi:PhnD/SsuA/transferrin family substrate-binding protein [Pseudomonas sp. F1_0610]|uniref:ABC transporter substrate-binding protein n=1 Tax=Pseudomonas sp. F1_0610 TaxID=3114284 RepID=UPI0039C21DCC
MSRLMRLCAGVVGLLLSGLLQATPATEKLILAGPMAGVSYALVHLVESGELQKRNLANDVELIIWKDPDQLRALTLKGKADFIAVPSNVAANLYNRGVPLQLLNISQWGVLWVVSREPNLSSLVDLKGKAIAIPFRADMPDIVFTHLAQQQGLNPKQDFQLTYTATPMDALQLVLMGKLDSALLAEPAVSMALLKSQSLPASLVAAPLKRSLDLQQEWGKLMNTPARIPQAGIAVLGDKRSDTKLVAAFEQAYAQANQWCYENAPACAKEVVKHIPMLTEQAVVDSLAAQTSYYATAAEAKAEIESFFHVLLEQQPAAVGNKLPAADFYAPSH